MPIYDEDVPLYRPTPDTPYQALMECAPGTEPETSVAEYLQMRDVLADAIEALPDRDQWIFNALFVEPGERVTNPQGFSPSDTGHKSLRQVAAELGLSKTQVARERDRILGVLQDALVDIPVISEHLKR